MAKSATARRSVRIKAPTRSRKTPGRVPLLRLLREMDAAERQPDSKPRFTFIDLFAGIGGMRLPFEAVGGRCIFTCERDPFCQKTYAANFPDDDHEIAGDIRDYSKEPGRIPKHDVLLAELPVSRSRRWAGFQRTRDGGRCPSRCSSDPR